MTLFANDYAATTRTLPRSVTGLNAAWNGNVYCLLGTAASVNYVYTSPTGVTWTEYAFPAGSYTHLGVFGTLLYSINGTTLITSANDGITWTTQAALPAAITDPLTTATATAAIAVSQNTGGATVLLRSTDGITWSSISTASFGANDQHYSILYVGTTLYIFSRDTDGFPKMYTSADDGATWTLVNDIPSAADFDYFYRVAHNGSRFVGWTQTGTVYASVDAVTWTNYFGLYNAPTSNMLWTGDTFIFSDSTATLYYGNLLQSTSIADVSAPNDTADVWHIASNGTNVVAFQSTDSTPTALASVLTLEPTPKTLTTYYFHEVTGFPDGHHYGLGYNGSSYLVQTGDVSTGDETVTTSPYGTYPDTNTPIAVDTLAIRPVTQDSKFLGVAISSGTGVVSVATSSDGITWSYYDITAVDSQTSFNQGPYYHASSGTKVITTYNRNSGVIGVLSSPDLLPGTWTSVNMSAFTATIFRQPTCAYYFDNAFVIATTSGLGCAIIRSFDDGVTWEDVGIIVSENVIESIAFDGANYIAMMSTGAAGTLYWSPDLLNWTALSTTFTSLGSLHPTNIVHNGDVFAFPQAGSIFYGLAGTATWNEVATTPLAFSYEYYSATNNANFIFSSYAPGSGYTSIATLTKGTYWEDHQPPAALAGMCITMTFGTDSQSSCLLV